MGCASSSDHDNNDSQSITRCKELVKFVSKNDVEAVKQYIIDDYSSLLQYAKHIEMMRYLLTKNVNPDPIFINGDHLLIKLCKEKNVNKDIVKALVDYGANLEFKNREGKTAIMYLAQNKQKDLIIYLLKKGADMFATDKQGKSLNSYLDDATLAEITLSLKNRRKSVSMLSKEPVFDIKE